MAATGRACRLLYERAESRSYLHFPSFAHAGVAAGAMSRGSADDAVRVASSSSSALHDAAKIVRWDTRFVALHGAVVDCSAVHLMHISVYFVRLLHFCSCVHLLPVCTKQHFDQCRLVGHLWPHSFSCTAAVACELASRWSSSSLAHGEQHGRHFLRPAAMRGL